MPSACFSQISRPWKVQIIQDHKPERPSEASRQAPRDKKIGK